MNRFVVIFSFVLVACSQSNPEMQFSNPENAARAAGPELCESPDPNIKIDIACLEKQLKGDGLGGWVHASVADQSQIMFVFTWRRPGNFFVNMQLPMASKNPEIMRELAQLRRHDQIVIKGEFFDNEAPIEHINVTGLKIIKKYEGAADKYQYDPTLPLEIIQGRSMVGKIHIVVNGGSVIVVEVGDRVYPITNTQPDLAQGLFRNDKVEIQYTPALLPMRPPHLDLNTKAAQPIRVIEEIRDGHGETITLTGPLVMFPQSPQLMFNVFAVRQEDADDVRRNFTIVNFENIPMFKEMRDKLQKVWDENVATATYDRNKYINRSIQITVTGKKNLVSPTQANPQVLFEKIDDLKIEIL